MSNSLERCVPHSPRSYSAGTVRSPSTHSLLVLLHPHGDRQSLPQVNTLQSMTPVVDVCEIVDVGCPDVETVVGKTVDVCVLFTGPVRTAPVELHDVTVLLAKDVGPGSKVVSAGSDVAMLG